MLHLNSWAGRYSICTRKEALLQNLLAILALVMYLATYNTYLNNIVAILSYPVHVYYPTRDLLSRLGLLKQGVTISTITQITGTQKKSQLSDDLIP